MPSPLYLSRPWSGQLACEPFFIWSSLSVRTVTFITAIQTPIDKAFKTLGLAHRRAAIPSRIREFRENLFPRGTHLVVGVRLAVPSSFGRAIEMKRVRQAVPLLCKALDVIVTTRMSDPRSLEAILAMSHSSDSPELKTVIQGLAINEAAILPGPVTGGKLLRFGLLPRLTPHVRHRVKYFDVSVGEGEGFVFARNGNPARAPARSLREFVSALTSLPPDVLDGHAKRGDFSRWILDVFRDHPLSSRIRNVEEQYRLGHIRDLAHALPALVRERYDLPSNINVPG